MRIVTAVAAVAGVAIATSSATGVTGTRAQQPGYVTIPLRPQHSDLLTSFDQLHQLGLRVALSGPISVSALVVPAVVRLTPSPGTSVRRGSMVRITTGPGPVASPVVAKSDPHYRVPSFVGQSPDVAVSWAQRRGMFWSIPTLPALSPSTAPDLFAAYRVVGQEPAAGGTIRQGVMTGSGGYRPTPVTLVVVVK